MGLQGPLTAQALGRSPYDDVVYGDGDADDDESGQRYDYRGRAINPETKRINRDIIRSHNEVMHVIGVAEPENASSGPEAESQRKHFSYEQETGQQLSDAAHRCVDSVGIFGIHGLRQRILIYRRYSQIPFAEIFQKTRRDFSFSQDILPGIPTSLVCIYLDRELETLWMTDEKMALARSLVLKVWSYVRAHLKLFATLQRIGLISPHIWFPVLSYFIPFTDASPVAAPPALRDFSVESLFQWLTDAVVSATPLFAWITVLRMTRDLRSEVFSQVLSWLPNPQVHGRPLPRPYIRASTLDFPAEASLEDTPEEVPIPSIETVAFVEEEHSEVILPDEVQAVDDDDIAPEVERRRRASVNSARGDDYHTDEEEVEGVSATLISFDVEATEATDAPPGLWSAELRPSLASDSRFPHMPQATYLDTELTRLPACLAASIFTNAVIRLLSAPYEAVALRLIARSFRLRYCLPVDDIYTTNMLEGYSWSSVVNYFGVELVQLGISGELWAVFAGLSQWLHMSEEDWKTRQGEIDK